MLTKQLKDAVLAKLTKDLLKSNYGELNELLDKINKDLLHDYLGSQIETVYVLFDTTDTDKVYLGVFNTRHAASERIDELSQDGKSRFFNIIPEVVLK